MKEDASKTDCIFSIIYSSKNVSSLNNISGSNHIKHKNCLYVQKFRFKEKLQLRALEIYLFENIYFA